MSKDKKKYRVGYGKPPKKHRFVKGQSGNPSGRPRKKLNQRSIRKRISGNIVMEILEMKQNIRLNGIDQEVSVLQSILLSIAKSAAAGKPSAQRLVMQLYHSASEEINEFEALLVKKYSELGRSQLESEDLAELRLSLLESLKESDIDIEEAEGFAAIERALQALNDE